MYGCLGVRVRDCHVRDRFSLFGFLAMILDIPGTPRWAGRYRQLIRKHARFLTRLTGKSLWLFYLGTVVALSLWPTGRGGASIMLLLIALGTSLFVISVAILGLLIAVRKSLRLEKVRKSLQAGPYKGNPGEIYRKYAVTDPAHGLQFEEFNRMAADVSSGRLQFDVSDLGIIYNAMDEHQKSAVNEREFFEWMNGVMTYV
eukprot:GHVU01064102.1.p1 GENE.GHVU01064102.1~~GHVU01064102.1.p1  ORF type:complete len:201 (-),score=34.47 GHVU01064102.1:724-1326(-)